MSYWSYNTESELDMFLRISQNPIPMITINGNIVFEDSFLIPTITIDRDAVRNQTARLAELKREYEDCKMALELAKGYIPSLSSLSRVQDSIPSLPRADTSRDAEIARALQREGTLGDAEMDQRMREELLIRSILEQ